jgi:3-hydroxyacyl-[acyl-carrier-protein] dehydratase
VSTLEITEIMKYLPHRYPFLLVDRILEVEEGRFIRGLKNVTINEPFFPGHFPHHPVMPGVLIIEAMAQVAAILAFKTHGSVPDSDSVVYFAGIDHARFKRPVVPGDQLIMEATIKRQVRHIWKFSCLAKVGEETTVEAELMCAIKSLA